MADMFLTKDEIATLTGRKYTRLQIEQLRKMGIPFWVNALNAPVVARATIEGHREKAVPPKPKWESSAWKKLDNPD
jgi:hypothetical protein